MGTFIWRSLAIVPFHLFFLILFTCNLSATSTQLTSSTLHDSLGLDVCKLVYCGKGTCNVAPNALFGFRCDCDSGWKKLQIHLPPILGNDTIEFPPCIIPNCTFDSRCGNGSVPEPKIPDLPINFTNPCLFSFCGDGTCVEDAATGFRCQCNEGSANLVHDPKLTCIKKCALGLGCSGLDLLPDPQTPPPPENSSSPPTGLGEMLNWSRGLHLLSTMMFATITFLN